MTLLTKKLKRETECIKDGWLIDYVALPLGSAAVALLLFALFLWAVGCGSVQRPEEAAREEYAKVRAGCYETAGYWGEGFKGCMKEKGWRE